MQIGAIRSVAGRLLALIPMALAASLCALATSASAQTPTNPTTPGSTGASVVVVALDPAFAPYSSVGRSGQLEGFAVEALAHLGPAVNMGFATVQLSLDSALEGLLDGSVGLAILPKNADLQGQLEYSQPLCLIEPSVFWAGKQKPTATRLGVVRTDLSSKNLAGGLGGFPIDYSSRSEALVALSQGKLDAVICAGLAGIATANSLGLKNINSTPAHLAPVEYCFAATQANAGLIANLNSQLELFNVSPQRTVLNQRFLQKTTRRGLLTTKPWVIWLAYPVLLALAAFAAIRLYQLKPLRKRFPKRLSISAMRGQHFLRDKAAASLVINPADNTIHDANQAASNFFGYSIRQLKSKQFTDLVEQPDKPSIPRLSGKNGGSNLPQQYKCRLPNGETREVEIHSSPIGIGKAGLVCAIVVDVTGRNRASEQLRQSEGRLAAVFSSTSIGIALVDSQNRFIQVNASWAKMLGYTDQELLELGPQGVTHPEDRETSQRNLNRVFSGQQASYRTQQRFIRQGVEMLWADITASPILDEQGQVEAVVWLAIDIADVKQGEAERDKLILELGQATVEIKTLLGLLPICSYCKKIRDDSGYWQQIEGYIKEHSDADFTHGICPDCTETMYPGLKTSKKQP